MTIIDISEWLLELNIECPKCDSLFNYLETKEYEGGGFESLKHCGSDDNANIKVKCPDCGEELFIKKTCW